MHRRSIISMVTLFVLASGGVALAKEGAPAAKAGSGMHAKAIAWGATDLKWEAMPGVEGVQVATLWGDMSKGGYGAFVRLPADQKHPLHIHTHSLKVVIISGEFVYGPEGGPEQSYGAGSYLMIPGGLKHSSASGSSELLMFQESTGKWDLKPVMEHTAGQ